MDENENIRPERPIFTDEDIRQWAIKSLLIKENEPVSDAILDLVDTVVEKCASIGDHYDVNDENAGEEIRAMFGLG